MGDVSTYLTVGEAASELGLSSARVRALIESKVLLAEKIAGRWVVSPDSVRARQNNASRRGRRLAPERAWQLMESGVVAQLLVAADEPARHNVRVQLASRATRRDAYVLEAFVPKLAPIVMPGGRALAEDAGVPAGRDIRWVFDGYIHAGVFDRLESERRISAVVGDPNARFRLLPDRVSPDRSRAMRLLVAWLDLADDGDRAADLVWSALISELHREGIERFPVGSEVVARASLSLLADLYDEVFGKGAR